MSFTFDQLTAAKDVITASLRDIRPELLASYGAIKHKAKADKTIVTELDGKVEKLLARNLQKFDAAIPFSGEESGTDYSQTTYWLADGIDGTEQFVRGIPMCTNMIALIDHDQVILSVIYNFALDECYVAIKGHGAHLNDSPIQVSDRPLGSSFAEFETNVSKPGMTELYGLLKSSVYGLVNLVCAGYGFTQVAKGAMEARCVLNGYGYPWDYAPGSLLVTEAGGLVANVGSTTYDFQTLHYVASNRVVHDELQQLLSAKL